MIKKSGNLFKNFIYKIIIFASFFFMFFIIGCNLTNQLTDIDDDDPQVDNSKAIIVTVDGLSFVNTLANPVGLINLQSSDYYLQTNLNKLINLASIRAFHWDGDAGETAAIIGATSGDGLRKFLIDNYNEAIANNKAFIVVGHSWGSFLTYLALSLEPQIQCDLFITLSCPLGTASGVSTEEDIVRGYTDLRLTEMSFDIMSTGYPHAVIFYNYWANGDLISGSLAGKIMGIANVQDVKVDDDVDISNDREVVDSYFWHKFTTLGDEVVNTSDPNYLVYSGYLATIIPFPYDISSTRNDFINHVVGLIQTASGY